MNESVNDLIEWIPNISTGDKRIVDEICQLFSTIPDLFLLHTDRSPEVNRTVFTLVGNYVSLESALLILVDFLNQHLNMELHTGSHPRMGLLDVSPYVLLSNGSDEHLIDWVNQLARHVSAEFNFPLYLFEKSARQKVRSNLADIRRGEYEGLPAKLRDPLWLPDFGITFNPRLGATVMGVRDFLIAYNVNLSTSNIKIARNIARDIRTKGPADRRNSLPGLKAIGWYLKNSGICQISTNITRTHETTPLDVFNRCRLMAKKYDSGVTGSELIGLIPNHSVRAMLTKEVGSTLSLAGYLGLSYCGIRDLKDRIIEHKAYIASGKKLFNDLYEGL